MEKSPLPVFSYSSIKIKEQTSKPRLLSSFGACRLKLDVDEEIFEEYYISKGQ